MYIDKIKRSIEKSDKAEHKYRCTFINRIFQIPCRRMNTCGQSGNVCHSILLSHRPFYYIAMTKNDLIECQGWIRLFDSSQRTNLSRAINVSAVIKDPGGININTELVKRLEDNWTFFFLIKKKGKFFSEVGNS